MGYPNLPVNTGPLMTQDCDCIVSLPAVPKTSLSFSVNVEEGNNLVRSHVGFFRSTYPSENLAEMGIVLNAGDAYTLSNVSTLCVSTNTPLQVTVRVADSLYTFNVNKMLLLDDTYDAVTIANPAPVGGVSATVFIAYTSPMNSIPNPPAPSVTSVNGKTGDVLLTYADIPGAPAPYVLPVATTTILGGVKQGNNISIASDGTISAASSIQVNSDWNATSGAAQILNKPTIPAPYVLPAATTTTLGGVKVGSGLNVAADGTISATGVSGVSSVNGKTGTVVLNYSDLNNLPPAPSLATLTDVSVTDSPAIDKFALVYDKVSGKWVAVARPYDFSFTIVGTLVSGEKLQMAIVRGATLPAGLAGSVAVAKTAASATTTLNILKNGTQVGTIVFAATNTTGTFTMATATTFANGDVLEIDVPSPADTTLADLAITLQGTW